MPDTAETYNGFDEQDPKEAVKQSAANGHGSDAQLPPFAV
jgi:hypothetical protein